MKEDIQAVLALTGLLLTFASFEVLAIPGFQTQVFSSGDSTYELEKQVFGFQLATYDGVENKISVDSTFELEDECYVYKFRVNHLPIPDLTGWSRLTADFLTKKVL